MPGAVMSRHGSPVSDEETWRPSHPYALWEMVSLSMASTHFWYLEGWQGTRQPEGGCAQGWPVQTLWNASCMIWYMKSSSLLVALGWISVETAGTSGRRWGRGLVVRMIMNEREHRGTHLGQKHSRREETWQLHLPTLPTPFCFAPPSRSLPPPCFVGQVLAPFLKKKKKVVTLGDESITYSWERHMAVKLGLNSFK